MREINLKRANIYTKGHNLLHLLDIIQELALIKVV
jgi:hypothetical protein